MGEEYSEEDWSAYGEDAVEESYVEDQYHAGAEEELRQYIGERRRRVFYSRQLEVLFEGKYFHWITNAVLHRLEESGFVKAERRDTKFSEVYLLWHKSFRDCRRTASKVVDLIEAYSDPVVTDAIGQYLQTLVWQGFARHQFVMVGENTNEFEGKKWAGSGHDLDYILRRDGAAYGIEVKNTLGYMDKREIEAKIGMCKYLGIRPVFAVRMIPKTYIDLIRKEGGFSLVFRYWMYPPYLRPLVERIREELGLPADTPRRLEEGTMKGHVPSSGVNCSPWSPALGSTC